MQVWCGPALYEGDPTLPHVPWDHAAYLAPINTGGGTPAGGGRKLQMFFWCADTWTLGCAPNKNMRAK